MIHELRSYTLVPAHIGDFLALTRDVGMPIRLKHSPLLGYWTVDVGRLNQVVSLWAYEDFSHRTRVRTALASDTTWNRDFIARSKAWSTGETSTILSQADVWPYRATTGNGVYELRCYQIHTGKTGEWLQIFGQGLQARQKYSVPNGVWVTELGPLNRVFHLWGYPDLQARSEVRRAAAADPTWTNAVTALTPITQWQRTKILIPTAWSPLH